MLGAYWVVVALNLWFVGRENEKGKWRTKPLLMPVLAVYYLLAAPAVNWLILLGVVFGFLGDTFLLKGDEDKFFLLGLVSFLLGHVMYIVAFALSADFSRLAWYWYLPAAGLVVAALLVFRHIKDDLGDMQVPVLVYMGVILLMSFMALARASLHAGLTLWLVVAGSLLFIASDSMLAIRSFRGPFRGADLAVMATYLAAQFLIVQGFLIA